MFFGGSPAAKPVDRGHYEYLIPPYIGHNGWIGLDVTDHCDPAEVAGLALESYRHFALKRMLQEL